MRFKTYSNRNIKTDRKRIWSFTDWSNWIEPYNITDFADTIGTDLKGNTGQGQWTIRITDKEPWRDGHLISA